MKRMMHRIISGVAAAMVMLALVPQTHAQAEKKTIRVAFPTQEGMSFFGHSGKVTGYNYDYLDSVQHIEAQLAEAAPNVDLVRTQDHRRGRDIR